MAPMIGRAGPIPGAGPSHGAGLGVGRCAGGGAWSPVRGGAAVAALPAGHAPGAGPRGKLGERSRRLAGNWRDSAGAHDAGVVGPAQPGALQRRGAGAGVWEGGKGRRAGGRGQEAAPGLSPLWEGYTGSGRSFAALVRGISSGIENA